MPNWLQRIAKGQMELNNETPNSSVINTVMSDDFDKNKDEAVKAAIQRDSEIDKRNAGILATAMSSMFPVLDFSKYGFLKGLAKVGLETATGTVGGYLGNRGGKYLDDKLGTSFLQGIGSFAGGLAGYRFGNKTVPNIIDSAILRKNILTEKLEFVGPKTYSGYHQSDTYFEAPTFPSYRWDVINHNADPNGFFLTLGQPANKGFLAKRPYTLQFTVDSNKGLVQHGEIKGFLGNKNKIRNKIIKYARKKGADVVYFDGIKDNTLPNQQILFATDKSNIVFNSSPIKYNSKGFPENLNTISEDLISDINAGKQDALNFLSSEVKRETDVHNKALAKRLGWNIVQTPERANVPMKKTGPPFLNGIRIGDKNDGLYIVDKIDENKTLGRTIIFPDLPKFDEMYITPSLRPRQTTFHEYLHRGDIGGSIHLTNPDTKRFFDFKANKILNSKAVENYLKNGPEAAANILEIGNALNIPIGTKYPGRQNFYNIINEALAKNDPKLNFLKQYRWKDKPKRVWDAMTGRYFSIPIIAIGGEYATKEN